MTTHHVVLVGLMGSGKTTVGRRLAASLQCPFLDTDEEVERRTGRTVRDIFTRDGEDAFRVIEHDVLRDALATADRSVIAAAGGAVLRHDSRELLKRPNLVVWLRADSELLIERVGRRRGHRPLLDDDPATRLRSLAVERDPIYRSVAEYTIDVDDKSIDEVCDDIVKVMS